MSMHETEKITRSGKILKIRRKQSTMKAKIKMLCAKKTRRRMWLTMRRRKGTLLLSGILMLSLLTIGCSKTKDEGAAAPREVSVLTVQSVKLEATPYYYETSGTLKARSVSQVAPKALGAVTQLLVKSGDRVKAGQLLATLENNDSRQKLAAAEAGYREAAKGMEAASRNLELQEITYERYQRLFASEAIARQQLDQIETQAQIARLEFEKATEGMNRAQALREEARAYDGYTRLLAPTDGIVTEKHLEVGSMLQPGAAAITVEDASSFLVEAYLEESQLGKVALGMPVRILLGAEAAEQSFEGNISEIVPAVDSASRSFLLKVTLAAAPALHTGQYAKVQIALDRRQAMQVPLAALVNKGELTGVYVVDADKRIWYRMLRLGNKQDGQVEVLAGLKSGEQVVVKGVEEAVDGGVVREVNLQ